MEKSIFSEDYAVFLSCLKEARQRAGLTQAQLAERLGGNQSIVSKCERGERRIAVVELLRFCDALGISLHDFTLQLTAALAENKRRRKRG